MARHYDAARNRLANSRHAAGTPAVAHAGTALPLFWR